MSKPEVSPATKAGWGIAYASVSRTKRLTPALRRAYGDGEPPFDLTALAEATSAARGIHAALVEASNLLGVETEGFNP